MSRLVSISPMPAHALGSTNRVYTVNPLTGAATKVGTPFNPAVFGNGVGFDINPAVDRLRVITSTGQNLRLVPATGAVAGVDKPLAYADGDRNDIAADGEAIAALIAP